jgi:hypothetical protein
MTNSIRVPVFAASFLMSLPDWFKADQIGFVI